MTKKTILDLNGNPLSLRNHFGKKLLTKKELPENNNIKAFIDLRGEAFSPPDDIMFTIKRGETLEIMVNKKSATKMAKAACSWAQTNGQFFLGREDNCEVSRIFIKKIVKQSPPWWFNEIKMDNNTLAKEGYISTNCHIEITGIKKMPKGSFIGLRTPPKHSRKLAFVASKWAISQNITFIGVTHSTINGRKIILRK